MLEELMQKLLCTHEYERQTRVLYETNYGGQYIEVLYQCRKCGKFKKVRI